MPDGRRLSRRPLTYRLGKPFVHVDTYAMANLVAGARVVPELIQDEFTPEAVAAEALRVLTDPAHAAARADWRCATCAASSGRPARAGRAARGGDRGGARTDARKPLE